ncbi:MAG: DUF1330 domain-containing protein [Spirochaetales bacterium]|nr:DUF1330 domain-containing protein [Leptospiraceae bacterium]MCP5481650.1 DUF1330 domain-containing protein [Spirochaetales bacterium]
MSVIPDRKALRELMKMPAGQPVVMLNLLSFRGEEGRASYERYVEAVRPLLAAAGASPIFFGDARAHLVSDESWDMVLMVRYPEPRAFLRMASSPEYQKISHLREEALERAGLIAIHERPGSGTTELRL